MLFRPVLLVASLVASVSAFYGNAQESPEWIKAVVTLSGPTNVKGTISFKQHRYWGPVSVTGTITGLDPNALRGWHIHELGDLSNGCASTGTHYNPYNYTHGAPTDSIRHVGDLGNIQSDASGTANVDISDLWIQLRGFKNIIGRALVVHNSTDDLGTGGNEGSRTTGNAGGRSACGIIGYAAQ